MAELLGTTFGLVTALGAAAATPAVILAILKVVRDLTICVLEHQERMAAIQQGRHVEFLGKGMVKIGAVIAERPSGPAR